MTVHTCVLVQHLLHAHPVQVLIHLRLTQTNASTSLRLPLAIVRNCISPGQCPHLSLTSLPILDLPNFQFQVVLFPLKSFPLFSIRYNLPSSVIVLKSTLFKVLFSNALYLFMHIY